MGMCVCTLVWVHVLCYSVRVRECVYNVHACVCMRLFLYVCCVCMYICVYVIICGCVLVYLCACIYVCLVAYCSDSDLIKRSEPGNRRPRLDPDLCSQSTDTTDDSKTNT